MYRSFDTCFKNMDMESLPSNVKCKLLSESEAIKYLSKVIELIGNVDSEVNSDIVNNLIMRLSNSYFDYYNKFIDKVCEHYISKCIIKNLYRLLLKLTNESTIDYILTFLVNFSEHSEIMAYEIGSSDILKYVIDKYFGMNLSDPEECKSSRIFKLYVTIIHNFFRYPYNRSEYKIDDIKQSFFKMIQLDSDDYFGIISMLILSYVIDEKEVDMLIKGQNILHNLLQKIKFTSTSTKRIEGFNLQELMHGLRCIAANDTMKKRIYDEGIEILINVIKFHKDDKDVIESTLGVIEHLCFDDEIKLKLIKSYKIKNLIKPYAKCKSVKIKKIYDGILWKLDNKSVDLKTISKSDNMKFDVFISYCWANKEQIEEILESLKIHKIRAWIDKEQMSGSSIDAMAKGIENSAVFIIGMSSSYKKSCNCRHEAEYAFYIKKPIIPLIMEMKYKPTEWLGFLLGNKIYFEFSDRRNPNEEVKGLIVEINRNLHPIDNEVQSKSNSVKNTQKSHDLPNSNSETKNEDCNKVISKSNFPVPSDSDTLGKIKMWTNEDVLKWLDKIQMSGFKTPFKDLSGSHLLTMKEICLKDPSLIRDDLKKTFNMNIIEIVKFETALKNLSVD